MTVVKWTPSPALANAVSTTLQQLARHWPRTFTLAKDTSDAGTQFVNDYAFPLSGVDINAILQTARRWISENSKPPSAAELANLARKIARELRTVDKPKPEQPELLPPPLSARVRRINAIGTVVHKELGTWRAVSQFWSLLHETAPDDAARAALFDGTIDSGVIDDAVAAIKRNPNYTPKGPLSRSVARASRGLTA